MKRRRPTPPRPGSWRDKSRQVMEAAIAEWCADHGCEFVGHQFTQEEQRDLLRHVSKAYPFGERAMHPYKAWLLEFRSLKACFDRCDPPSATASPGDPRPRYEPAEQMRLEL